MDLLWIILPVVLLQAEAKKWTKVWVDLGQDVTLNCSLDPPNIHWFMEIDGQLRASITRTFTSDNPATSYYVYTPLRNKYTALGEGLVIRNITAEDYRLYFCARKQNYSVKFEDTFSLVSDVLIDVCSNTSGADQQQQHIWRIWQSEPVMFSSLALNVILLSVVTVLVVPFMCLKKKNCNHQVNEPSPFTNEDPEKLETPQYEEIHLGTYSDPSPAAPPDCIYYKAQLPQSTLHQY